MTILVITTIIVIWKGTEASRRRRRKRGDRPERGIEGKEIRKMVKNWNVRYLSFSSSVCRLQIGFYSLPTANLHGTNELESIRNVEWRWKKISLLSMVILKCIAFSVALSRDRNFTNRPLAKTQLMILFNMQNKGRCLCKFVPLQCFLRAR